MNQEHQDPEKKPTPLERFVARLQKIVAPDIDPNDQVRIMLRLLMIVGVIYYLGTGIFGILTA